MRAVAAVLVVCAALAGCKAKAKKKDPGGAAAASSGPLMTPAERRRGEDACTTYVKELCACAAAKPDDAKLAELCELKHAKPEALELLLAVDNDPKASLDSRQRALIESRKLIAKCVMEQASLPSLGCH
jgi:hypothetical protein